MNDIKKYNYIDFTTFIVAFILMAISVLVVYTASSSVALSKLGDSEYFLNHHLIKIVVAVIVLLLGILIDYKKYKKFTKFALLFGILLLILTLKLGDEVHNTKRFISIGSVRIQPSELVKFLLVAHIAKLLSVKSYNVRDFKNGYLPLLIWICIVVALIILQKSYSMGTIIFITCIIMIYLGGVRLKHLMLSAFTVVPVLVYFLLSEDYRLKRILLYIENFEKMIAIKINEINNYFQFTNNLNNSLGQIWQSIIAFGNGGILGVGLGNSRQRDFYIPEAYNDFIFSIIGEEYGLIGTLAIITLFTILFLRGLKIARYAKDDFGRYLAIGITLMITNFALVNTGVSLAIIPATGLPMPLVSYGGSSFIATAFAIGVLLNISKQTDLNPKISHVPLVGTVNAEGKI